MLRFFVIMHIMNINSRAFFAAYSKRLNNASFVRLLVLFFVFSSFALIVVQFFSPFSVNENVSAATPLVFMKQPATEINPADFNKTAVAYSDETDKGLLFYRDSATRDNVIWFYTHITGNVNVARAILEQADKNNIPLSLAFSLAYIESHYKTKTVNHNKNSTIDRGLFQLNNKSFPKLDEQDFFDPYINARYGLSHLRYCLDTAGNEISALAMYNAGVTKVKTGSTPQLTLNYVSHIIEYRKGIDSLFEKEIVEKKDETLPVKFAFKN